MKGLILDIVGTYRKFCMQAWDHYFESVGRPRSERASVTNSEQRKWVAKPNTKEPTVNTTCMNVVTSRLEDESQTIRCPKCGRTDYIRDMEKDMGIKGSCYKYKCVNCNTYIKDEPTISKMEQVEGEPQTDTGIAKAIVHKMIDDAVIAEDAYPDLRQKMHDAVDEYEPQTDYGDFADRLAYERGVKHAWEVAQKVFNSTVTFYEAEDVAKQVDKDINVRSKDEQTEREGE